MRSERYYGQQRKRQLDHLKCVQQIVHSREILYTFGNQRQRQSWNERYRTGDEYSFPSWPCDFQKALKTGANLENLGKGTDLWENADIFGFWVFFRGIPLFPLDAPLPPFRPCLMLFSKKLEGPIRKIFCILEKGQKAFRVFEIAQCQAGFYLHNELSRIGAGHCWALPGCHYSNSPYVHCNETKLTAQKHAAFVDVDFHRVCIIRENVGIRDAMSVKAVFSLNNILRLKKKKNAFLDSK